MKRKNYSFSGFLFNLIFIFSILLPSFSSFAANEMKKEEVSFNPSSLLKGVGFSLVKPQEIPNLTLPSINLEHDVSLKEFKGKWLFLVFWATWCGPCVSEMPTLETLSQELPKDGASLLGISIDNEQKMVRRFVDKNNIHFPIAWDENQEASRFFNASSVPLMYVISPDSRVVGVFRGAFNWENPSILAALKELSAHRDHLDFEISSSANETDQDAQNGIDLSEDLKAPEMNFFVDDKDFKISEIFYGEVRIKWKGDSQKYLLKVPKITLPPEVKELSVSSYSEALGEESSTTYKYQFVAEKEGSYKLGPVEMEFIPRMGGRSQFSRASDLTIEVKPTIIQHYGIYLIMGGILGIFSMLGGWVLFKRKKEKNIKSSHKKSGQLEQKNWLLKLEDLKATRTKQDPKLYAIELVSFWKEFKKSHQKAYEDQEKILEAIKFAGKKYSSEELTYFEKELDKEFKLNIDFEDETMEEEQ